MTQHLLGVLQVVRALQRRRAAFDIDTVARLSGTPSPELVRDLRKLARWGLIDTRGGLTPRGEAMTARLRSYSETS